MASSMMDHHHHFLQDQEMQPGQLAHKTAEQEAEAAAEEEHQCRLDEAFQDALASIERDASQQLRNLIEEYPELLTIRDDAGRTLLSRAVLRRADTCVDELLRAHSQQLRGNQDASFAITLFPQRVITVMFMFLTSILMLVAHSSKDQSEAPASRQHRTAAGSSRRDKGMKPKLQNMAFDWR